MRRAALPFLLAALALPAAASASGETGRLLVSLEREGTPTARASAATAVAARAGARAVPGRAVPEIGLVTVRPAAGASLAALARRLRDDPRVRSVDVERRATLRLAPNDPALTTPETASGTPAGVPVQWWIERQGFFRAWDYTRGTGAKVAVIDTGVDGNHPEFAGRLARANDLDDDPRHGPATTDENGHGSHVASFACGATNNAFGIASAGFDCTLIIEKSDLTDSSVARAIVDATDAGAHAINMSFGTDGRAQAPQSLVDAVDYAFNRGVVLVAAAADQPVEEQGDPSNVLQPTGSGPNIDAGKGLSITAADFSNRRASFAGLGTQISLAAYGTFDPRVGPDGLLGAFPANTTDLERPSLLPPSPACNCRATFQGDNRFAYLQGTSMSSPVIAGAAALVRHLNPDLTIAEVLRIMKQTARRPAGVGFTNDLGWGIVDAGAAVEAARLVDKRAPTSSVTAPRRTSPRRITLRITKADEAPPGLVPSGVRTVRVFRSTAGAAPVRVATTSKPTLQLYARAGVRYSFFTVAVDGAGNVEATPAAPDARTTVRRRRP